MTVDYQAHPARRDPYALPAEEHSTRGTDPARRAVVTDEVILRLDPEPNVPSPRPEHEVEGQLATDVRSLVDARDLHDLGPNADHQLRAAAERERLLDEEVDGPLHPVVCRKDGRTDLHF